MAQCVVVHANLGMVVRTTHGCTFHTDGLVAERGAGCAASSYPNVFGCHGMTSALIHTRDRLWHEQFHRTFAFVRTTHSHAADDACRRCIREYLAVVCTNESCARRRL